MLHNLFHRDLFYGVGITNEMHMLRTSYLIDGHSINTQYSSTAYRTYQKMYVLAISAPYGMFL